MSGLTPNHSIFYLTAGDPAGVIAESASQATSVENALNSLTTVVTTPAALDAISSAKVGARAYMTSPGTGIEALSWEAYVGTGAGLDWHIVDTVRAATKANLDSFISAIAAIADLRFVVGGQAYVTGTGFGYSFTSDAGALRRLDGRVVPSAVTNGSVDTNGVCTSGAVASVTFRDCFPTEFTILEAEYDFTTSAAASINSRLSVDATAASTGYDNQRTQDVNATNTDVQTLNVTDLQLSPIALAARHVGKIIFRNPNVAVETLWDNSGLVTIPAAMTASCGIIRNAGGHRTATAYNSWQITPVSGNITVNRVTFKGVA